MWFVQFIWVATGGEAVRKRDKIIHTSVYNMKYCFEGFEVHLYAPSKPPLSLLTITVLVLVLIQTCFSKAFQSKPNLRKANKLLDPWNGFYRPHALPVI